MEEKPRKLNEGQRIPLVKEKMREMKKIDTPESRRLPKKRLQELGKFTLAIFSLIIGGAFLLISVFLILFPGPGPAVTLDQYYKICFGMLTAGVILIVLSIYTLHKMGVQIDSWFNLFLPTTNKEKVWRVKERWKTLAGMLGLKYDPGGHLIGKPKLSGVYRGHNIVIKYSPKAESAGAEGFIYQQITKLEVTLLDTPAVKRYALYVHYKPKRKGFLAKLDSIFSIVDKRWGATPTGNFQFDEHFFVSGGFVRGMNDGLAGRLIISPEIQNKILELEKPRLFKFIKPYGKAIIEYEDPGNLMDIKRMQTTTDILIDVAEKIESEEIEKYWEYLTIIRRGR